MNLNSYLAIIIIVFMAKKEAPSTDDILKKYGARIKKQMGSSGSSSETQKFSKSYAKFKGAMIPEFSRYEKWCKTFGNFIKMKVGEKDNTRIQKAIDIAHLNVTPGEVVVLATVLMFGILFGGSLFFTAIWLLTGAFSLMFLFLVFILGIFTFFYASKAPERLAIKWRLKASSQMVPAILYIVIYMKHTSNFEKAMSFAAEHLSEPLSLDFRKIFWDVEVGRFSTIKESVDHYLERWRDYSMEFIEAFHLIESSLFEPSESRRVQVLEKSLQVILDGVYDKMLKYTHEAKAPLTNVYMLGIVLPTLALAILPLASTMLGGAIRWYHVLLIFNVIIPMMVLYMTGNVMMRRPGGYGESDLLEKNPLYPKYASNAGYWKGFFLASPLLLIGLIPFLWRYTAVPIWLGTTRDYAWSQLGLGFLGNGGIFGILTDSAGNLSGPFGSGALLLSLAIPAGIAIVFIVAAKEKTHEIIEMRNKYKDIEKEFTSSLFQLGNRIGDGSPAEIAFSKVAGSVKGTATEGFFRIVNENIGRLGMNLERALFDPRRGAVTFYPSQLVATSMKILVESAKKGLKVAARSLMAISDYVKNIKKIDARLNDLLADIISDMKSNMTFLAPLLSGIIVGLSGMITTILGSLSAMFEGGGMGSELGAGGITGILSIFDITKMIPTYWLQIVIGVYLIQVVFILTSTLVTIKSGRDILQATAETGKNLKVTMILYTIIAAGSIIGLTVIGSVALAGLT
jgi:Flp pilus assembly protein TadB